MKHKEIIKAWLDGETVEYINDRKQAITLPSAASQNRVDFMFDDHVEYRIKPKTYKYRIAMFNASFNARDLKIIYEFDFGKMDLNPNFIRWVSEILELEP